MSGRNRHQYGRSATTSYSSILSDSGDILNRCSNLFSKFASRVRAASQSGEDRMNSNNESSVTHGRSGGGGTSKDSDVLGTSSSYSRSYDKKYPLLLKYNKYEDTPRFSDYKESLSNVNSESTKPTSLKELSPSRYRSTGTSSLKSSGSCLTPSASFSSFSNLKSDYCNYKPPISKTMDSSGSSSLSSYSSYKPSSTTIEDYGLKSAYSKTYGTSTPNYDKIASRYKPSRFLKTSISTTSCNEEDENTDDKGKPLTKKKDYWSHYTTYTPSHLVEKYTSDNLPNKKYDSDSFRRHLEHSPVSKNRVRPVTLPERKSPRESTASILQRYSGISAALLEGDSSKNTPEGRPDEATRRKERDQLMSMYSLPLDVLQTISNVNARKYRKRGKDNVESEREDGELNKRYDQVRQMASQMSWYSSCNNGLDDEGILGPPRKLYGSASSSDIAGTLSSKAGTVTTDDNISKQATPESDKYVLHEAPIVFEKAGARERMLSRLNAASKTNYLESLNSYKATNNNTKSSVSDTASSQSTLSKTSIGDTYPSSVHSTDLSTYEINRLKRQTANENFSLDSVEHLPLSSLSSYRKPESSGYSSYLPSLEYERKTAASSSFYPLSESSSALDFSLSSSTRPKTTSSTSTTTTLTDVISGSGGSGKTGIDHLLNPLLKLKSKPIKNGLSATLSSTQNAIRKTLTSTNLLLNSTADDFESSLKSSKKYLYGLYNSSSVSSEDVSRVARIVQATLPSVVHSLIANSYYQSSKLFLFFLFLHIYI
ncbi:UNVERIFIED_CONTAM: hypothetical protein RMT77_006475 [Armadillidium vulgare]